MKLRLLGLAAAIAAAVQPAAGVQLESGVAIGAGLWEGHIVVAFEASHAQGSLFACDPEDLHCTSPSYGTLAVAKDSGEAMQGSVSCLQVSGGEAFMGVTFGSTDHTDSHPELVPSAAYAAIDDAGEPVFALLDYAGSPCNDPTLRSELRANASPLVGGAVLVTPCEVLVCPYA